MQLVFLGTSGMIPTKARNVQGIFLEYNGEGILLDCGEGTQRQMTLASLSHQKIKKILISHWHGDHVSGLLGMLQTVGNFSSEGKCLMICGPVGTKEYMDHLVKSCVFDVEIDFDIREIDPNGVETFYENENYELQAVKLEHSVPCIGYRFVRKEKRKVDMAKLKELGIKQGPIVGKLQRGEDVIVGNDVIKFDEVTYVEDKKVMGFILDTQICDGCYDIAEGSDILISEAVYCKKHENKASEYKHMTSEQAAQVASMCGVEQLILTHFSSRYKDLAELEYDAKEVFENVTCAYDFMKLDINF